MSEIETIRKALRLHVNLAGEVIPEPLAALDALEARLREAEDALTEVTGFPPSTVLAWKDRAEAAEAEAEKWGAVAQDAEAQVTALREALERARYRMRSRGIVGEPIAEIDAALAPGGER